MAPLSFVDNGSRFWAYEGLTSLTTAEISRQPRMMSIRFMLDTVVFLKVNPEHPDVAGAFLLGFTLD